jgi:hypothetical protein
MVHKSARTLLVVFCAALIWAGSVFGFTGTGSGSIWAMRSGDFVAKNFSGDTAGRDLAYSYCGSSGFIQIGPGLEAMDLGTIPAGITVIRATKNGWEALGTGIVTPRLGPSSSAGIGGAIRVVDGVTFPQTIAGIQLAINDLPATGGRVVVPAATYLGTAQLSLRSNLWLDGAGIGNAILRRNGSSAYVVLANPTWVGTPDSNIVVSGFTIDGQRVLGTGAQGVRITNARKVTLRDLKIVETGATSLVLYGNTAAGPGINRDIAIEHVIIDGSDDAGMDLSDAWGLDVSRCEVYNTKHIAINLEPRNDGGLLESLKGVRVVSNFINNTAPPTGSFQPFGIHVNGNHGGVFNGEMDGVVVSENTILGTKNGIVASGPNLRGAIIANNTVQGSRKEGIALWNEGSSALTKNVLVIGNHVLNCAIDATNTFSGMVDSNAVNCSFIGNYVIDTNGSPKHKYGIEQKGASSTGNSYALNYVSGYATAPDNFGTTAAVNATGRGVLEITSKAANPTEPSLALRPFVNDGRTSLAWLARNPVSLGYRPYGKIDAAGPNGGNLGLGYMSWYTSADTTQANLEKRMDMGINENPTFLNWVNFKNVRYYSPTLNPGGFTMSFLESLMTVAADTTGWAGPSISLSPRSKIYWRSNAFPWTAYPIFQKDNQNIFYIADINTPRVIVSPNGVGAMVATGLNGIPGVRIGDTQAPSSSNRLEVAGQAKTEGNLIVTGSVLATAKGTFPDSLRSGPANINGNLTVRDSITAGSLVKSNLSGFWAEGSGGQRVQVLGDQGLEMRISGAGACKIRNALGDLTLQGFSSAYLGNITNPQAVSVTATGGVQTTDLSILGKQTVRDSSRVDGNSFCNGCAVFYGKVLVRDSLRVKGPADVVGKATVKDTLRVGGTADFNSTVTQFQGADVASTASMTLGVGNAFNITGTTTVTSITAKPAGTFVTLFVPGALQFTSGSNLKLNGNFVGNGTGNDDVLNLYCDGTNYKEIGRVQP